MSSFKLSFASDFTGLDRRFSDSAIKNAQVSFAQRVGFDSNYYAKVATGATRDSMQPGSDFEAGEVRWTTSYARDAYYNPTASRKINPNASPQWFERAQATRYPEWLKLVKAALDG